MKSRKEALLEIFEKHGPDSIYVSSTGYLSRACYDLFKEENCFFYMNGSMGLAPGICLGIALNTKKDVVAISGDASLLMHLGLTHTIRDANLDNLYHYVLDNGCHESVGGHPCSHLERDYPGVTEIIKINKEGKTPRVGISFKQNFENLSEKIKSD